MRRCQIVPRARCSLGGWACARSKPLSDGGDLSSDGGLTLLRRSDQHIGLSRAAAAAYGDARDPRRIEHRLRDLLAQRLYAICCGYEDLNDHDVLRGDSLMQTAVGRDAPLASSPISVGWRTELHARRRGARSARCAVHRLTGKGRSRRSSSTSTPPTCRCTARRSSASSMRTTIITATCHCTCSAARRCSLLPTPKPRRWRQARGGDRQVASQAAASPLAADARHRARRLGVLPPATDLLVRARVRGLRDRGLAAVRRQLFDRPSGALTQPFCYPS